MHFFIGTTNPNKVREIAAILRPLGCTFDVTYPIDPEETEADFVGNAFLKARTYAAHAGGTTISEDSGLVIPALGGLPGPWSARFCEMTIDVNSWTIMGSAPQQIDREERDRRNNARVLELMADVPEGKRAAKFVVVLAVCEPDGTIRWKGIGESHGYIATECRGTNGFGYDPVFIGNDTFGKTYAELDSLRKNLRSHRRRVLEGLNAWLGNELKPRSDTP